MAALILLALCLIAGRCGPHEARAETTVRLTFAGDVTLGSEEAVRPKGYSLDSFADRLTPGGRIAIITFHSLEDRIVKNRFRINENPCTCPPSFPVCVCGKTPQVKLITRKPIVSGQEELERNPRARSAKLRICEKL